MLAGKAGGLPATSPSRTAIAKGRTPRCSGELAYHVLEIMTGILAGSETGGFVEIASRPPIPDILPETYPEH